MPEAPEVRRYADELAEALTGSRISGLTARTKTARAWLNAHPNLLTGRRIERVYAHGKNIVGEIEGDYFFYSHQMMWGSWTVVHQGDDATGGDVAADRRERARITTPGATALLLSAPIFEIGKGDPMQVVSHLRGLGPYVLPYEGAAFDHQEFRKRLRKKDNAARTIGDALLDQRIVAGLGNYLRAEIMFLARINPWTPVSQLSTREINTISTLIEKVCRQAYEQNGTTVTAPLKARMSKDSRLVYVPGKEYGTRHYVFRRTNLPCLICDHPIKQLRQAVTRWNDSGVDAESEMDEMSRIVYFCSHCQHVDLDELPRRTSARTSKTTAKPHSKPAKARPRAAARIEKAILSLVATRSPDKSVCPSEVARHLQPDNWRPLMAQIREVADDLNKRKLIRITQRGKAINSAAKARGPVRFSVV